MGKNILELCEVGNFIEVKIYLDEEFSPNFQNNEGISPLQIAAANGFNSLVELLLENGALVDLPNYYGWTPLMHAAKYGHTSTVSILLKMKAKVNIRNKLGISAVVIAGCSGNLSTVKLLVEAGAIVDHMYLGHETNECDFSIVMASSLYGHEQILEYLLNNCIDVNHSSAITGLTPLMLATCGGYKQIISMLVENEADINKTDICGRTALDFSHIFKQKEIENYLTKLIASKYEHSTQTINIFEAIKHGDISKMKLILEKDPDSINSIGRGNKITPLMLASNLGFLDIVNILIVSGANLDIQDMEIGWTALMHAVYHNHSDIVHRLLEGGANARICTSHGITAFDLSQQNDNIDSAITEMLTKNIATVVSQDISNRGRLSAPERLPSKRSSSQTRVKEWIGGVAHHLQHKMQTLRSNKLSENLPSIEVTSTDDSINEVFLETSFSSEQTSAVTTEDPVMLPPDLYLADILKDHKVEAIVPPFPPILTESMILAKDVQRKSASGKTSKPLVMGRRFPNLLKNYRRTIKEPSSCPEKKKNVGLKKRDIVTENNVSLTPIDDQLNYIPSASEQKESELDAALSSSKSNTGELTVLLNKESLEKYVKMFHDQEVDIETFQHLTEDDLSEIGIQNTDSQKKLMKIIKKLQSSA